MQILTLMYVTWLALEGVIASPMIKPHKLSHLASQDSLTADLSYLGNEVFGIPKRAAGQRVQNWSKTQGVNVEELGGYAEGDILFSAAPKNGWAFESRRWPGKKIPYVFSRFGISIADREMIEAAIDEIHNYTCIRFVPRTHEEVYIQFTSKYAGCYSSVGYSGRSYNVNLQSKDCTTLKGTVLHELLHVIGFVHEHSRAERDDYVSVKWDNINKKNWHNFNKYPRSYMNYYGVPYDYTSVMHYSRYALSEHGEETIVPADETIKELGQREKLSAGDILKLNRMYRCHEPVVRKKMSPVITKQPKSLGIVKPSHTTEQPHLRNRTYCWEHLCWTVRFYRMRYL